MVESQAQYHRSVLVRLEKLIPRLNDDLTEAPSQGVFGLALEDHLRLQGREIASPLETCIFWISELGVEEEGLFRIAGSASKIKLIRVTKISTSHWSTAGLWFHLISGFLTNLPSHQGKKEVACVVSKPLVSCLWGCGEPINPLKLNIQEVQGALSSKGRPRPAIRISGFFYFGQITPLMQGNLPKNISIFLLT